MANWENPSFEVEVSDEIKHFVPLPKRLKQFFTFPYEQQWSLFCGNSDRLFHVGAEVRLMERKLICCIGWGWENLLDAYDIRGGDILRIYVIRNTREFRIQTWRNNQEVNGQEAVQEDDDVEVLEDEEEEEEEDGVKVVDLSDDSHGSNADFKSLTDDDGDTSDDDSDLHFVTRLTRSYIDMNRMNVSLSFAYDNFAGFNEVTPVTLRLGQQQ